MNFEDSQYQVPHMQPVEPKTKPSFDLTKGDNAFALCGVLVSVFTSVFGIFGGFSLGYLLSIVFMMALFLCYFAKGGKARFFPIFCGVLALANSAVFICTSNASVRFFGVIVSFLLALVCYDGLVGGEAKGNRQTLRVFSRAVMTMGNVGRAIKSLFVGDGKRKTAGNVVIGLLCAIPVLVVVVPLLMSDDAFYGMVRNVFGDMTTTAFKLVFGLVLSMFVISYGFSLKAGQVREAKPGKFSGIENAYIISFLSAISVCYLLYLFSQLAYFFSAFRGFLPDGEITYAQYARKGFFEMCMIAIINLGIVFLSLLLSKKRNGKACHGVKALATFIAAFTLIIIATAISKMVLYIDVYGMTVLRLTTSAFMLFLSVVFISVILRIYITKINVVKTALVAAGCIVLALGTANVNAICARYNYQSYMTGRLKTIDVDALYYLGDEGIPYIAKLVADDDAEIAKQAESYLTDVYLYDYFEDMTEAEDFTVETLKKNQRNKGIERFRIPKKAAYDALYGFIEDNASWQETLRQEVADN